MQKETGGEPTAARPPRMGSEIDEKASFAARGNPTAPVAAPSTLRDGACKDKHDKEKNEEGQDGRHPAAAPHGGAAVGLVFAPDDLNNCRYAVSHPCIKISGPEGGCDPVPHDTARDQIGQFAFQPRPTSILTLSFVSRDKKDYAVVDPLLPHLPGLGNFYGKSSRSSPSRLGIVSTTICVESVCSNPASSCSRPRTVSFERHPCVIVHVGGKRRHGEGGHGARSRQGRKSKEDKKRRATSDERRGENWSLGAFLRARTRERMVQSKPSSPPSPLAQGRGSFYF